MDQIHSNNGATLVFFEVQPNGLISAVNSLNCAYVRAYLNSKGHRSTQYIQEHLPNIYDLVDDIISLGNEIVVFFVSPVNYYISKITAIELKKNNENTRILWVGPSEDVNIHDEIIERIITENSAEILDAILANVPEEITSLKQDTDLDQLPSPYLTGILPAAKAIDYGVRLSESIGTINTNQIMGHQSVERIISELDYISGEVNGRLIRFITPDILRYPNLEELLSEFKRKDYSFFFGAKIVPSDKTIKLLDQMIHNKFTEISFEIDREFIDADILEWIEKIYAIRGDYTKYNFLFNLVTPQEKTPENESYLFQTINYILKTGADLGDNISFSSDSFLQTPKIFPEREQIPLDLSDLKDRILNNNKQYRQTLINGFNAFMTGLYPSDNLGTHTKHIGVKGVKLTAQHYNQLKDYLGINSAVIIDFGEEDHRNNKTGNWYTEDRKFIKSENTEYDEYLTEAVKNDFYLSHLNRRITTQDGGFMLQMDDLADVYEFSEINYADLNDTVNIRKQTFVKIESREDLNVFLTNLDYFKENGMFKNNYEIAIMIKEGCRWLVGNSCLLNKLPRFSIDGEKNIIPCGGCSKSVGNLSQPFFNTARKTHVVSEQERVKRNCAGCEIREECSKCALIQDFLTGAEYCEIRKSRPFMLWYFMMVNVVKVLKENSKTMVEVPLQNIKISGCFKSHLFTGESGNTNYRLSPYVYLFFINNIPIVFDAKTMKVLKINDPMAFILEGIFNKASRKTIEELLADRFDYNSEQSTYAFQESMKSFIKSGFLTGEV
jgi:hypothetical protein